jgi:cell division protein FtsN
MEKTEKFFIFTWKELIVIVLLVVTLVGFFFTLGLHYGKQIAIPSHHAQSGESAEKTEEGAETVPPKENLEASSNHSKPVMEETIKQETAAEVEHSGVKIDHPKAVSLPHEKKADAHHEEASHGDEKPVAVKHEESKHVESAHSEASHEAAAPAASESHSVAASSGGSFFIQLGSYTMKKEALAKIKALSKAGVKSEIQIAEVNHVTRFRVVISGFKTKPAADQFGRELKQKHKIDNYIVIK